MPLVFDPPAAPPLTPPAEDARYLWQLIYDAQGFRKEDDPATGYQLQKLCEALCIPYQDIYDLLREREDGTKPWEILFDPDRCPFKWLRYLSQYVGLVVTPELEGDEAQWRAEIKHPTSWKRGQTDTIRLAARRTLRPVAEGEELRVIIRPRTPNPGEHQIRTWLSQTPEPARTEQILREELAAWERMEYQAVAGMTYADVKAEEASYAAVKADFATYKDLVEALP